MRRDQSSQLTYAALGVFEGDASGSCGVTTTAVLLRRACAADEADDVGCSSGTAKKSKQRRKERFLKHTSSNKKRDLCLETQIIE